MLPSVSRVVLPADAAVDSEQFAALDSVSCTAAEDCVAVGSYFPRSGLDAPMLANETNGVWSAARKIDLHGGTLDSPDSVSCTSSGNCVVVGADTALIGAGLPQDVQGGGGGHAIVATQTRGVWGTARKIELPANALTPAANQSTYLASVTCMGAGRCVAVGSYLDRSGAAQAMVATETRGAWSAASEVALPVNALATSGKQQASLDSVSCTSAENCIAVGSYQDTNGPSDQQAMVVTETNGVWGPASEVELPANAAVTPGSQHAALNSVVCPGAGSCVAVGGYEDTVSDAQAMVVTRTGGIWGMARETRLPAKASPPATLDSISCPRAGSCVAVGNVLGTSAARIPMVASETNGVWGLASETTLPAHAVSGSHQEAALDSVACPRSGDCVASGEYTDYATYSLDPVGHEVTGTGAMALGPRP